MGSYTPNLYFYKPALGAAGSAEKFSFDAALDTVDSVIYVASGIATVAFTNAATAYNTGSQGLALAVVATSNAAVALTTATNALSVALTGSSTASAAYVIAVAGSSNAGVALTTATNALSVALTGSSVAASALSTAQAAVVAPATNSADYLVQWNGTDSKTVKNGLAVGTAANNVLALNGSGQIPAVDGSLLTNLPVSFPYTAGDTIIFSADTLRITTSTSYVKAKEIIIGQSGTIRTVFTLDNSNAGAGSVYGCVYRNGTAVGTERSLATTAETSYSEDIAGWARNDLCQLYHKSEVGAASAAVFNFRISVANPVNGGVITD